jgi:hypothetical protein
MNILKRKIKSKYTHKPSAESVERRKAYKRRPIVKKGKFRGTTARMIVTHTNANRHVRRYGAAIKRSIRKLMRSKNA